MKEVQVDDETVEAVPEFCYLGDLLSAGYSYALQIRLGQVLTATPPPHHPQSSTFD